MKKATNEISNEFLDKEEVPFTQIPNNLICNPSVSAKAKAVYCYVLSRPNGWRFYLDEIANNMTEGRGSIREAIKELESFGYLRRWQIKDENGRFIHTKMITRNQPLPPEPESDLPHPDSPHTEKPHAVNCTHSNTDLTNTDLTNTDHKTSSDLFPDTKAKKKTKSQPLTIEEWEKVHGVFDIKMLAAWGREKNLDANKILPKVEEYRLQWKAKGYTYANFVAAFQQWINRDGLDKYKKTTQPDALPAARFTEGNEL